MPSLAAAVPPPSQPIDLGVLPSELDSGLAARAAIGLVVLATDQTMEHEFRALIRLPGVAFYEARLFNDNDITPDTLRAIGPRIAPSVDLILPSIPLDVVAFGCTSATMMLGEEAIFAEIRKARPQVACTTPVTAALAAFAALDARGIGLLTPYAPEINHRLVAYFGGRGVNIAAVATFNRPDDREAARISVASIEAAATGIAATPGVDAIFVACTSLRVAEAAAGLEQRIGIPITSSNHAMAWHCLRLAGVDDAVPGAGRLFAHPIRWSKSVVARDSADPCQQ
jgi:maleate isomerase